MVKYFFHFQVKHSKTSSPTSYENDFRELINIYSRKKEFGKTQIKVSEDLEDASDSSSSTSSGYDADGTYNNGLENIMHYASGSSNRVRSRKDSISSANKDNMMSVEYLEDEFDSLQDVDDLDGNLLSPYIQ